MGEGTVRLVIHYRYRGGWMPCVILCVFSLFLTVMTEYF